MLQPATVRSALLASAPPVPARIRGLATAVPDHRVETTDVWTALSALHGRQFAGRTLASEAPRTRFLAEPLTWVMQAHTLSQRTDAYLTHARRLALRVATAALRNAEIDPARIGLVVFVSCTGFVLPSLDAELIPALGLRRDTVRLPIAELGCGGGVAALGRAHDYLRAYPDRSALVAAVELPSLTFQPEDRSTDNLIAALVFGDGAGAAILESGDGPPAWHVLRTGTVLVPEGAKDLGYELRDGGLRVVLTRRLPAAVAGALPDAVSAFLEPEGLHPSDLDVILAHPGGQRILDAVGDALQVAPRMLEHSRRTFLDYGNGSSAGIFFVLAAASHSARVREGLAIAFGPGLSIELARIRYAG